MSDEYKQIEYPAAGSTYCHEEYGVYQYGTHPEWSVLAGQEKRTFLGSYEKLEDAQREHPDAEWDGEEGSSFREPHIPADPPAWFDPSAAGESWDGE